LIVVVSVENIVCSVNGTLIVVVVVVVKGNCDDVEDKVFDVV
jgi:hypothetical protein